MREILSEELLPLPVDFLEDLRSCIEQVDARITESEGSEPLRSLLVAEGERLKSFYDQIVQERISKILLSASRGKKPQNISDDEGRLFEGAVSLSQPYKERFYRILSDELTALPPVETRSEPVTVQAEGPETGDETRLERGEMRPPEVKRNVMLRIAVDFPRFVGPDLKNYGPFKRGEIVALPDEVSELLLTRKVGEGIGPEGEVFEDAEED